MLVTASIVVYKTNVFELEKVLKSTISSIVNIMVGSINSIFYFLHKAAEPFNCLEQDNLA